MCVIWAGAHAGGPWGRSPRGGPAPIVKQYGPAKVTSHGWSYWLLLPRTSVRCIKCYRHLLKGASCCGTTTELWSHYSLHLDACSRLWNPDIVSIYNKWCCMAQVHACALASLWLNILAAASHLPKYKLIVVNCCRDNIAYPQFQRWCILQHLESTIAS